MFLYHYLIVPRWFALLPPFRSSSGMLELGAAHLPMVLFEAEFCPFLQVVHVVREHQDHGFKLIIVQNHWLLLELEMFDFMRPACIVCMYTVAQYTSTYSLLPHTVLQITSDFSALSSFVKHSEGTPMLCIQHCI